MRGHQLWLTGLLIAATTCVFTQSANASSIPIDSTLFTVQSTPGAATWAGNTLTLDLSCCGAFTQTAQLPYSALPPDIVGISFEISSTLVSPRITVGVLAYDSAGNGQGEVALFNYASPSAWDLTTFSRLTTGLGYGRTTSDSVAVFLGSGYSPFALDAADQNSFSTYPRFSLDFRADGYDPITGVYDPGTVTFADIQWLTAADLTQVPEPNALTLLGTGLLGIGVRGWRDRRQRN